MSDEERDRSMEGQFRALTELVKQLQADNERLKGGRPSPLMRREEREQLLLVDQRDTFTYPEKENALDSQDKLLIPCQ